MWSQSSSLTIPLRSLQWAMQMGCALHTVPHNTFTRAIFGKLDVTQQVRTIINRMQHELMRSKFQALLTARSPICERLYQTFALCWRHAGGSTFQPSDDRSICLRMPGRPADCCCQGQIGTQNGTERRRAERREPRTRISRSALSLRMHVVQLLCRTTVVECWSTCRAD